MKTQQEYNTVYLDSTTYELIKSKAFLLNQVAPYLDPEESLEYWMVMYEGYGHEELANLFDIDLKEVKDTFQAAQSKMKVEDLGQALEALININPHGYSFEFVADASNEDTIRLKLDTDESVEARQDHLDTAWRETMQPRRPPHQDAPNLRVYAPERDKENTNKLWCNLIDLIEVLIFKLYHYGCTLQVVSENLIQFTKRLNT